MSHEPLKKLMFLVCRKLAVVVSCAAVILGTWLFGPVEAGVPDLEQKLPGTTRGRAESRWIAPYALFTQYGMGETYVATVRWFDDKGHVVKELTGNLMAHPEFVMEFRPDGTVYHDVNGKWNLFLPKKPDDSGYVTSAGDTFVHEFHPTEGEIAADIYLAGKLIGTVGPFVQYKGRDVRLAEDGSMAFMAWKTPKKDAVQVVVVGPDGKVSFCVDCGQDVDHPHPVGGGKGVIVEVVGPGEHHTRFRHMQSGGNWVPLEVGPNARSLAWTSDGAGVLFCTSIGTKERFKLIDPASGKLLWETPSPVKYYEDYATSAVVLDDKLLFIGHDFAAVDIKTGQVIARWEGNTPRSDRGWIARRGDRLFFVTNEEFVEIDPADIAAKKNGWH